MDTKTLGTRVREERTRAGMSQHEFARRVGVRSRAQARIEAGERQVDCLLLHRMAEVLEVSMERFFDGEGAGEPESPGTGSRTVIHAPAQVAVVRDGGDPVDGAPDGDQAAVEPSGTPATADPVAVEPSGAPGTVDPAADEPPPGAPATADPAADEPPPAASAVAEPEADELAVAEEQMDADVETDAEEAGDEPVVPARAPEPVASDRTDSSEPADGVGEHRHVKRHRAFEIERWGRELLVDIEMAEKAVNENGW